MILAQLAGVNLAEKEVCILGFCFSYSESFNSHLVSYARLEPWNFKLASSALLYILLFASFYFLSLRLRRVNASLKPTQPVAPDLSFLSVLNEAQTLDELNQRYHQLIGENPHLESIITALYKAHKSEKFK